MVTSVLEGQKFFICTGNSNKMLAALLKNKALPRTTLKVMHLECWNPEPLTLLLWKI
jgi:hypothetical protein